MTRIAPRGRTARRRPRHPRRARHRRRERRRPSRARRRRRRPRSADSDRRRPRPPDRPRHEPGRRQRRLGGFPAALAPSDGAPWAIHQPRRGARPHRPPGCHHPRPPAPTAPRAYATMAAASPRVIWLASWSWPEPGGASTRGQGRSYATPGCRAASPGSPWAAGPWWVTLYGRRPDEGAGRRRGPSALLVLDAADRPAHRRPAHVRPARPWQLAADGRGAWVRAGYRVLLGWDARHRAPRRVRMAEQVAGLALAPRAVWVPDVRPEPPLADRPPRRRAAHGGPPEPRRLPVHRPRRSAGSGRGRRPDLPRRVLRIDPATGPHRPPRGYCAAAEADAPRQRSPPSSRSPSSSWHPVEDPVLAAAQPAHGVRPAVAGAK